MVTPFPFGTNNNLPSMLVYPFVFGNPTSGAIAFPEDPDYLSPSQAFSFVLDRRSCDGRHFEVIDC